MIEIKQADNEEARGLIYQAKPDMTEYEDKLINQCLAVSIQRWVGLYNGELVNAWGLIPPTLLSTQAYLWMIHTEKLKGREFVFIRHSQRAVEEMLRIYPEITGYAQPENKKGIQWIKWLGGEFGEPKGDRIPFVIRSKWNG